MNIKILDSWLRVYLKTKAKPHELAEKLSLTSVSIERMEKFGKEDYVYDIEITTNRPDLMSVIGLAREAAAVLPEFGIAAEFIEPEFTAPPENTQKTIPLQIINDPKLVNRIAAVILEVDIKESPKYVKERLDASGIRSLNNVIDVTNYIMREVGYPTHVFDYDRLNAKKISIRESRKGEKIKTLDGKPHVLQGGDIIAVNEKGEIVDLIAIMGLENSVITNDTKRIVFFINHAEPHKVRKTSMSLGIRTEAAILNEKEIDPELITKALYRGIELFKEIANARPISKIIDIYPNKPKTKQIKITKEKIDTIIGIEIPLKTSFNILNKLGFKAEVKNNEILANVPTSRNGDVSMAEDLVEEIARVYGYYRLPSVLPPLKDAEYYHQSLDPFYWEKRVKNALKYWGFAEIYTYSMVSKEMINNEKEILELDNPLTQDMVYMRKTLLPSLLNAAKENKNRDEIKIFELSNVYIPRPNNLPKETLTLAALIKKENLSFYEVKGIIEQLINDLGIHNISFKSKEGNDVNIYFEDEILGEIKTFAENIISFEVNFELLRNHATLKKIYKPIPKFPPSIEDLRFVIPPNVKYKEIISIIKEQSSLITAISLLDTYRDKMTFRIKYQDPHKTLTAEEVSKIREKIISSLGKELEVRPT
ncbi:MAG: phenylalanine--tRNA ligase subunit beta [Patescibacteria group bacterium]|nr:phenylalanine--tRNA ligase subunit beta [Patescibacteria group bacterium]